MLVDRGLGDVVDRDRGRTRDHEAAVCVLPAYLPASGTVAGRTAATGGPARGGPERPGASRAPIGGPVV